MAPTVTHSATRAEHVADALREAIQRGDYLSGERLVELTLARDLGVSQNTVRDALRILEQEGWVVKRARRGVFVCAFTPDEACELCDLVETLEGLALEWAIQALTKTDIKRLHQIMDQMRHCVTMLDWHGAMAAIHAFHTAIAEIAHKPQTTAILIRLHNQMCLLDNIRERRSPHGLPGWNRQVKAYRALLQAIEDRDVLTAQQTLSAILKANCAEVLACL
jgi:DNA-binding GntR family transcriptional regulator